MKTIEQFIDENLNEFNSLENSVVIQYQLDLFDNETIEYLKETNRHDYLGICVYYVNDENEEIWVENLNS
jgi:UDP-3-O-acyl-N-acetylglucosamine deacetylase